jgi:hypothetical protein
MTINSMRPMAAGLLSIGLLSFAIQPVAAEDIPATPVPANLEAPAGNKAYFKGQAVGTQNYICLPSGTGFAWTFTGPQATLFVTFNWITGEVTQQATTHYLSPNPMEDGTLRATWQSSLDTSAVWARAIATSTDAGFVAPGAIPWLLLQVVGMQNGPTGGSMLTSTTYIQRVNTSGGIAPTSGCTQSTNVGATAMVPYTTDYIFFKASQ